MEHGDVAGVEHRLRVLAVGNGDLEVVVDRAGELEALEGFGSVERLAGAVSVEKVSAGRVDPHAVGAPPCTGAVAELAAADGGDLLGDFEERIPIPLAGLLELAGILSAGLFDEVHVEVERKGGHVAGEAPQRLAGFLGRRVVGEVEHRAFVEVRILVVGVGVGQITKVRGESVHAEVGRVGARNPEHVGGGAASNFGLELILVRGAFRATLGVFEGEVGELRLEEIADRLVEIRLGVVVRAGAPDELRLVAAGRCCFGCCGCFGCCCCFGRGCFGRCCLGGRSLRRRCSRVFAVAAAGREDCPHGRGSEAEHGAALEDVPAGKTLGLCLVEKLLLW